VHWIEAALWGLLGGAVVAGLDFSAVIAHLGDWPWRGRKKLRGGPYLAGTTVRLLAGGGLAAAFGQSGLVSNALMALTIGVATPLIVEKLAQVGVEVTGRAQ
jgi:hypothetical protein